MNKAWITALSIAGIAGSAAAAYSGLSANSNDGAPVEAQGLPAQPPTTLAPVPAATDSAATSTYQVGEAGTVTVTNVNGIVSVQSAMPSPGWTVQGYTSPAGHVEVRFANPLQVLTFNADVVGGTMVASLAEAPNVPALEVPATEVPAPEVSTTVPTTATVPAVLPATPTVPTPPATAGASHTTTPQAPSHAATTSPSSHGGSSASNGGSHHGDDGDDEGENEHETEEDDD